MKNEETTVANLVTETKPTVVISQAKMWDYVNNAASSDNKVKIREVLAKYFPDLWAKEYTITQEVIAEILPLVCNSWKSKLKKEYRELIAKKIADPVVGELCFFSDDPSEFWVIAILGDTDESINPYHSRSLSNEDDFLNWYEYCVPARLVTNSQFPIEGTHYTVD